MTSKYLAQYPLPESPLGIHQSPVVGSHRVPDAYGGEVIRSGLDSHSPFFTFLKDSCGHGVHTVVSDPGGGSWEYIAAVHNGGLMPLVRLQSDGGASWPNMGVDREQVKRMVAAGAIYIVPGNEPDSWAEHEGESTGPVHGWDTIGAVCSRWMHNAIEILAGGGIPMLPGVNAGFGGYDRDGNLVDDPTDRLSLLTMLQWFRDTGNLDWLKGTARNGQLAYAAHNRGSNHPLDYPNDPTCLKDPDYWQNKQGITDPVQRLKNDSTCIRSVELADLLFNDFLGTSIPVFSTEFGVGIGTNEDSRFAKVADSSEIPGLVTNFGFAQVGPYFDFSPFLVDSRLTKPFVWGHSDINIAVYERFDPAHANHWPEWWVGVCHYHLGMGNGVDSPAEGLWENGLLGRDLSMVKILPEWWRTNASRFDNWPERWTGGTDPGGGVDPVPPGVVGPPPVVSPPANPPVPPLGVGVRKRGRHVISWNQELVDAIIATGSSPIKLMDNQDPDPIEKILAAWPDTIIVLRKFYEESEQNDLIAKGVAGGRDCANQVIEHFAQVIDVCKQHGVVPLVSGINEPPLSPYDSAPAKLAIFTEGFADEVVQRGGIPVTLSLSVGQPEGDEPTRQYIWDQLEPALKATEASGGIVEFHPYGRPPKIDDDNNAYYFNRPKYDADHFWPEQYRYLPRFYGETGLDAGTLPEPPDKANAGWKAYLKDSNNEPDPVEAARQLRWSFEQIEADPDVIGETPFTSGPTMDWNSFGIDGYDQIEAVYHEQVEQGRSTVTEDIRVVGALSSEAESILAVAIEVSDVAGLAKGFADVAYPIVPGNPNESRYGGDMTTEVGPFNNGSHTLSVNVGPAQIALPGPVVGELTFRMEFNDGMNVSGGVFGPFPVTITPKGFVAPAPEPTPPSVMTDTDKRDRAREQVFYGAGDGFEADQNPIWIQIQKAVQAMKEGATGPFKMAS